MLKIVLNFGLYSQQSSSDDLEASGVIGPQQTGLHGEENCTEIAGHPTKKKGCLVSFRLPWVNLDKDKNLLWPAIISHWHSLG